MIPYTFELDLAKYGKLYNIDFIGQSYLIANNIHFKWFNFFEKNQKNITKILDKIDINNIYPKYENIFNAFTIDPTKIKVILLGQDPYIKENQAHGYSFSSNDKKIPPSLQNIFKEINNEYPNKYIFTHGNLERWSYKEGIFLLNSALTVIPGKSNTHAEMWKEFTDLVIEYLSENYDNKIFLLLGNFAKSKVYLINEKKHKIVYGIHPSPLSAYNGFFNSNIFKNIDKHMIELYGKPIFWQN